MAIYIDIIARFNQRQLIKQGDELRDYINGLEKEIKKSGVRAAQGANRQLVKLDDSVATSRDKAVNATDNLTKAYARLKAAEENLKALRNQTLKTDKEIEDNEKAITAAIQEEAAELQNLVYKLQAENKATRDNELAKRSLNEETKAHAKNLRDVAEITNINRKQLTQLFRVTNKLRRDTENLHASNVTIFQDNKSIAKSMEGLTDATEKVTRAQEKYNEIRKKDGVTAAQIKAQGRVLIDAKDAERRKARDLSLTMVELIQQRREHDSVVNGNERSLRGLANQSLKLEQRTADLRSVNRNVIDQNRTLEKQFDRVGDSVLKVTEEFQKYHEMSQDGSVSSEALAGQIDKVSKAFVAQQRVAKDANAALDDYYRRQEEAERRQAAAEEAAKAREKAAEERARRKAMPQSAGQYLARNLGALTPLGTLSPTVLLPVAGILGTVANAAVTASQSLALLPAAGAAATAGITTLIVGFKGFGDALTSMGDPKKFAEALFQLSPNAQQAALSLKNLVDGPLGDLKRATQDALFADVSPTLQKLVQTFGPTMQRMLTSIATSFNQMFTGISFEFMTPEMQQRVGTITTNISAMFDRIRPGVSALVGAFTKIAETGSGFLPQLADGFSRAMISFDNFITRAQQDGSLQEFMSKGIDAIKAISKWLLQFGQEIYTVFGNKSPEDFIDVLNSVKDVAIGLANVMRGVAWVMEKLSPIVDRIVDSLGGWENVMWALVGGGILTGLYKFIKWGRELLTVFNVIGPGAVVAARGVGALSTAAAVAAGGAATAAAAKSSAAATAATFAAAGTTAGTGFLSKFRTVIKGAGWIGLGLGALSLQDEFARDDAREQGKTEMAPIGPRGMMVPVKSGPVKGVGSNPDFYKDLYPAGENPALPELPEIPEIPSIPDFTLPNVLLDENGKALDNTEILNKLRGQIPRDQFAVDPFTDPITGQKTTPMLPMGPNGMPEFPAGGVPGTPSIQGPVMPQYNSFGQLTGHGANMVDPEEVFDAQLAVVDRGTELEEAKKDLIAAQQSGLLSAEEVNDLERKVTDKKLALHKSLVQLGRAQTGDVEKLKTETDKTKDALKDGLGDFGASIDKDFGISKGLSGIVENLTKFLGNLAFAPVFGAIRGAQAGLGFPEGEGAGSGLAGMVASSMGHYKGGPLDPNPENDENKVTRFAPSYTPQGQSAIAAAQSSTPGYTPVYRPAAQAGVGGSPISGYMGDAALLAQVPRGIGHYDAPGGVHDLTKGLVDCTSGLEDLVNMIDGQSTAGRSFATNADYGGSAAEWLQSRGFVENTTGANVPGAFNIGFNSHHAEGTLPDGMNVNYGSTSSIQSGGTAGAEGAFGADLTSHWYRPVNGSVPIPGAMGGSGGVARVFVVNMPGGGFTPPAGTPGGGSPSQAGASGAGGSQTGQAGVPLNSAQLSNPGLTAAPTPTPAIGPPTPPTPPTPRTPVLGPPNPVLPPHFAKGGEVPIVAHSGEHVLTRDDVSAMGGQRGVYDFRRSLHYDQGGSIGPASPFSPNPFDPSNQPKPPSGPSTDLGELMGVGDTGPAKTPPAPKPPAVPTPPPAPTPPAVPTPPLAAEVPAVPAIPEAVAQLPETVLPGGQESAGSVIGAQVEAPAGYGEGLSIGGGVIGMLQGAAMSAVQGAGLAADAAGGFGGGSAGAAVASAAMQMGFEELNRAIEYGGQVAAIGAQGLMETFLPAGGSELAQNSWATKWLGGIAGAAPAIANLAGGDSATNQSTLAGVGGPPTPEQIAAQGMDPNRTQHTGMGAPAGPVSNVGVQIMSYQTQDNRPASQDFGRYAVPGQR